MPCDADILARAGISAPMVWHFVSSDVHAIFLFFRNLFNLNILPIYQGLL
jgi:hypothetical protein